MHGNVMNQGKYRNYFSSCSSCICCYKKISLAELLDGNPEPFYFVFVEINTPLSLPPSTSYNLSTLLRQGKGRPTHLFRAGNHPSTLFTPAQLTHPPPPPPSSYPLQPPTPLHLFHPFGTSPHP